MTVVHIIIAVIAVVAFSLGFLLAGRIANRRLATARAVLASTTRNLEAALVAQQECADAAERAEVAVAEMRATLDGIKQRRHEAGVKAGITRKAREQAVQTVAEVADGR